MKITFLRSDNEWNEYSELVQHIVQIHGAQTICDVGGGANPVLSIKFITENRLNCTVLDISDEELQKAPKEYKKVVQDIESKNFSIPAEFDLVITKMMAEHLRNGRLFHKNIFDMLKSGGVVVHYFPTLYALPFLINKLIPEWLSSFLLNIFLPRDRYQLGKFPAYYSWCYGPTPSMLAMLHEIGYEILEYRAFIGNKYYSKIPVIRNIHEAYSRYLVRHSNPYLTSFAQVILRKPEKSTVHK